MGACFGGRALDAFDVPMYSFVIPTVIAVFSTLMLQPETRGRSVANIAAEDHRVAAGQGATMLGPGGG